MSKYLQIIHTLFTKPTLKAKFIYLLQKPYVKKAIPVKSLLFLHNNVLHPTRTAFLLGLPPSPPLFGRIYIKCISTNVLLSLVDSTGTLYRELCNHSLKGISYVVTVDLYRLVAHSKTTMKNLEQYFDQSLVCFWT